MSASPEPLTRLSLPRSTAQSDTLRLPAEPHAIVRAREFAHDAAVACKLDSTECYKFVYAVNEAVTNAIKHGAPDTQGMITLTVAHDSRVLTIAVSDCGSFDARDSQPRADLGGGRGLALMIGLTDAISLKTDDSGTTVVLSKHLPAAAEACVLSP